MNEDEPAACSQRRLPSGSVAADRVLGGAQRSNLEIPRRTHRLNRIPVAE
jgi:hypothetical protein